MNTTIINARWPTKRLKNSYKICYNSEAGQRHELTKTLKTRRNRPLLTLK